MHRAPILAAIVLTLGWMPVRHARSIATDAPRGDSALVRVEFAQVHMGLPVRVVMHADTAGHARAAAVAAFARIAVLDRMMSDYRDDSELRRIEALAPDPVRVSPELVDVMTRSLAVASASGGAFDPTVAPLVGLWREARRVGRLPSGPALDDARALVGWRNVRVDPTRREIRLATRGMRLDLGGVAKGYILQDALRVLQSRGVSRALVEAGGDIVVGDPPPHRTGWRIETPAGSQEFARRAANLVNAALATSGPGAQHAVIDGIRYSHIIDPRSGFAVTSDVTARVIASDAAIADALATTMCVVGEASPSLLARFPGAVVDLAR